MNSLESLIQQLLSRIQQAGTLLQQKLSGSADHMRASASPITSPMLGRLNSHNSNSNQQVTSNNGCNNNINPTPAMIAALPKYEREKSSVQLQKHQDRIRKLNIVIAATEKRTRQPSGATPQDQHKLRQFIQLRSHLQQQVKYLHQFGDMKPLTHLLALREYVGNTDREVSFKEGDVVLLLAQPSKWWVGEVKGVIGCFPASYTRSTSEEELRARDLALISSSTSATMLSSSSSSPAPTTLSSSPSTRNNTSVSPSPQLIAQTVPNIAPVQLHSSGKSGQEVDRAAALPRKTNSTSQISSYSPQLQNRGGRVPNSSSSKSIYMQAKDDSDSEDDMQDAMLSSLMSQYGQTASSPSASLSSSATSSAQSSSSSLQPNVMQGYSPAAYTVADGKSESGGNNNSSTGGSGGGGGGGGLSAESKRKLRKMGVVVDESDTESEEETDDEDEDGSTSSSSSSAAKPANGKFLDDLNMLKDATDWLRNEMTRSDYSAESAKRYYRALKESAEYFLSRHRERKESVAPVVNVHRTLCKFEKDFLKQKEVGLHTPQVC